LLKLGRTEESNVSFIKVSLLFVNYPSLISNKSIPLPDAKPVFISELLILSFEIPIKDILFLQ
jgi:hypothetical protein